LNEKGQEEVVTESVTATTPISDDGEYIIKYPTTPYPDENPPATPSPDEVIEEPRPRMTEQAVITGEADCTCGKPFTRIVGGDNETINNLPWTVALMRKKDDGTIKGPYCGGTLICNQYIATASHCVDGFTADGIQVWVYEENFLVEDENPHPTIKVDVEEITMHPEYDKRKIDNDIALLKLKEPVEITKASFITPACLPADNENTFEGEEAVVAGWGATEQGGDVSPQLQRVEVPVLTNKQCNWRTLYLGKITDNMLCAGELTSGGKDSCQGDSGGPLVIQRKNQYILAGIVSFGYGCAQPYAPGVYTRVSRYPDWIRENTAGCQYCKN